MILRIYTTFHFFIILARYVVMTSQLYYGRICSCGQNQAWVKIGAFYFADTDAAGQICSFGGFYQSRRSQVSVLRNFIEHSKKSI